MKSLPVPGQQSIFVRFRDSGFLLKSATSIELLKEHVAHQMGGCRSIPLCCVDITAIVEIKTPTAQLLAWLTTA